MKACRSGAWPFAGRVLLLLAAGLLSACDRGGPADPAAAAAQVSALLAAGDEQGADVLLKDAVARWPGDARLREQQGDLDLQGERANLAQAAYEKAIALSPGNRVLQVKLARSLLAQRRFAEVLNLDAALDADPPGVRAGLGLARLEAQLGMRSTDFRGRREEAEALWRLVAGQQEAPGIREARERLVTLAGQFPAVEAGRQHAQCRRPSSPSAAEVGPVSESAGANLIRVGPTRQLKRPSEAAAVATEGAVVEIDSGTYAGDTVIWTADGLTLRGRGGRAHVTAPARLAEEKGIWLIKGDRTTVENMEFSGARSRYANGSGIRLEGSDLVIRNSLFHDNQMGILTTNNTPGSEVVISHSEFRQNTSGSREGELGHNIYIGRAGGFTLEFSYSHGARFGHNVKSRARVNRIRYNRIADHEEGRSSYLIDLPEGGVAEIVGNELQKGPFAENRPFISYGAEWHRHGHKDNRIAVVNNTFYSAFFQALGVRLAIEAPALVVNNLFAGVPMQQVAGQAVQQNNVALEKGELAGGTTGNFAVPARSAAIDAGVEATASGQELPLPQFEYHHPLQGEPRLRVWSVDAGAHEYCLE